MNTSTIPKDPFAQQLMTNALEAIRSSVSQRSQSYEEIAEEIARLLCRANAVSCNVPDVDYDALPWQLRERYQDEAKAAVLRQTELLSTAKSRAVSSTAIAVQGTFGISLSPAEEVLVSQAAREAFSELPRHLRKLWNERIASAVVPEGPGARR